MKYLFIIQGEGRGHFTQALSLREILRSQGHEISALLIGKSPGRELPHFFTEKISEPVLTFTSPGFRPANSQKRSRLAVSIGSNFYKLPLFLKNTGFIYKQIKKFKPDLVINFYELLTGLTYLIFAPRVPLICVGHQYLFLHRKFRFPEKSVFQLALLRLFTRLTSIGADKKLALSFYPMPDDLKKRIIVTPPLLRKEILRQTPAPGSYIHGYIVNNGYAEEIESWSKNNPGVSLRFFWDKKGVPEEIRQTSDLTLHTLDDELFIKQMAGCKAYSTTAGFESVCEAMYLNKPVLMVPVHIEQECNAFDAQRAGAGIRCTCFDLTRLLQFIPSYHPSSGFRRWVSCADTLITAEIQQVYEKRKPSLEINPSYS